MWYLSAAWHHPTLFMLHNKCKENNGSFSLCKSVILECHALSVDTYINELCVWSIGECIGTSWALWHYRPIDWSVRAGLAFPKASTPNLLIVQDPIVSLLRAPMPCLEHWWMPRDELSFMALQTDRLVCTSRISILKASTPNLLIVRDPFLSLLRAPMPCLKHWWMPWDELSFMALQTDRSIPIDWSTRAGLAFSRRPPPICSLCEIPSCHCWEHQCLVWSIGGCLGMSWALWHYRPIDRSRSIGLYEPD